METPTIQSKIHTLRGQRVLLDFDIAALYDIETRVLKQAVRRNRQRFPADFMFELSEKEIAEMVSQIVIPSKKYFGGAVPFAFTEQGVAMLSSILRSDKAIETNIAIMRAFVELRHYALTFSELAQKITELEARTGQDIADIQDVLRWLGEENQARANEIAALEPPAKSWETRRTIGFAHED